MNQGLHRDHDGHTYKVFQVGIVLRNVDKNFRVNSIYLKKIIYNIYNIYIYMCVCVFDAIQYISNRIVTHFITIYAPTRCLFSKQNVFQFPSQHIFSPWMPC